MLMREIDFFIDATSVGESKEIIITDKMNQLLLELNSDGNFAVQVTGILSTKKSKAWTPISSINASNYDITDTVEANGAYIYSLSGFTRIRLELISLDGGTMNAIGRIVNA